MIVEFFRLIYACGKGIAVFLYILLCTIFRFGYFLMSGAEEETDNEQMATKPTPNTKTPTPQYAYRDFRPHHNVDAFGISIHKEENILDVPADSPHVSLDPIRGSIPNIATPTSMDHRDETSSLKMANGAQQANGHARGVFEEDAGLLKPPEATFVAGSGSPAPTVRSSRY